MRRVSLTVTAASAVCAIALLVRAGQRTPPVVLLLMMVWVLAPFGVLLWTNAVSSRWSTATRATLLGLTLIVTLASLAVYGGLINVRPRGGANAFPFVIVPPASMALIAITVAVIATVARRRSRPRTVAQQTCGSHQRSW